MRYVEAPVAWDGLDGQGLFMAGGITGCPDWQQQLRRLLFGVQGFVLLNPRQANFPIDDPHAAPAQIRWEFDHFRMASAALFWFPKETLCPIVLYELGGWTVRLSTMWIGVHPQYQRRQDVEIQTRLARPSVKIACSLSELADQIKRAVAPVENIAN